MTPARMHWVWRVLLAVIVGFCASILFNMALMQFLSPSTFGILPVYISFSVVRLAVPVIAYGLLTHWFGPKHSDDGETHCRVCTYILRGISEPRCPECGERI